MNSLCMTATFFWHPPPEDGGCVGTDAGFLSNPLKFPRTWRRVQHLLAMWPGWPHLKQWQQVAPSPLYWQALQPFLRVSLASAFCGVAVAQSLMEASIISTSSVWSSYTRICTSGLQSLGVGLEQKIYFRFLDLFYSASLFTQKLGLFNMFLQGFSYFKVAWKTETIKKIQWQLQKNNFILEKVNKKCLLLPKYTNYPGGPVDLKWMVFLKNEWIACKHHNMNTKSISKQLNNL